MEIRYDILIPTMVYYFIATIGFGLYYRKRYGKAAYDFALASRTLPWWLVFTGAVLIPFGGGHTVSPAEATWAFGVGPLLWPILGAVPSLLLLFFVTGRIMRGIGARTVGEAMEMTFGPTARVLLAVTTCLHMMIIAGLELYGTASAIYGFTGFEYAFCIVIAFVLIIIYTFFAGVMQASVLNAINLAVYYVGFILAFVAFTFWLAPIGGWDAAAQAIVQRIGDAGVTLFSSRAAEMIAILGIPIAISHIAAVTVCQGAAQPVLSARDPKEIIKGWPLLIIFNGLAPLIWVIAGLLAFSAPASLYGGAAAVIEGMRAQGLAVPATIVTITQLWPAAAAALLMALLAATLSTAGAFCLGAATSLTEDIVRRFLKPDMSERSAVTLMRLLIVLTGVIALISAFLKPFLMAGFIWIFTFYIPLFISFILGLAWRRNEKATIATTIISWAINVLWILFKPLVEQTMPVYLHPAMGNVYPVTIASIIVYIVLALALKGTKPGLLKEIKGTAVEQAIVKP